MGRAGVALRPVPSLDGLGASLRVPVLTATLAAITALAVVAATEWLRLLCACVVGLALVTLTLARPSAGIVATVVFLVLLAFLRRLLIAPTGGWWPADPLLLVGPLVATVLIVKLFVLERRRLAPNLLSKLVLALLALALAEVLNPTAGVAAGIAGLLFMAVPLLWFFVGRELLSDALTDRLLQLVVVLGTVVGVYGLFQIEVGHPPWDVDWLNVATGFDSLQVGDQIRAFGTFASFAEYATFTSTALVLAAAFVLRGRALALLPLPVLGIALFLASSRTPLITAVLAVVVMLALRTRRPLTALVVILAAGAMAFGAVKALGPGLASASAQSQNDLVSHQLGGITDPLDPQSSTLIVHVEMVWDGVKTSLHHPIGEGTGSGNMATGLSTNSQTRGSTDIDISNAFLALGPAGGVVYVSLIVLALSLAVRSYFAGTELALPVVGVLVVGLGQWLNGGFYALSPLTWLLLGWLAASTFREARERGRTS